MGPISALICSQFNTQQFDRAENTPSTWPPAVNASACCWLMQTNAPSPDLKPSAAKYA